MTYPPSTERVRAALLAASRPLQRSDISKVAPHGGTQARAIALLKAAGECVTAQDPAHPHRALYWPSAEARDAWLKSKGARA